MQVSQSEPSLVKQRLSRSIELADELSSTKAKVAEDEATKRKPKAKWRIDDLDQAAKNAVSQLYGGRKFTAALIDDKNDDGSVLILQCQAVSAGGGQQEPHIVKVSALESVDG